MPRITFAIPYHTAPHFLIRAMESIRHQTEMEWDLIVCDDSDGKQPIEQLVYSYDDYRMRYWRNECKLGKVGNWNRCLDMARSEFVTVLRSDDELRPEYAALMMHAADSHPQAVLLSCASTPIDEHGREIRTWGQRFKKWRRPSRHEQVLQGESSFLHVAQRGYDALPTACFRMEKLADRRYEPMWNHCAETDFAAGLLLDGDMFVGMPQPLHARRQVGPTVDNVSAEEFEEALQLHKRLVDAARKKGWQRAARTLERGGPRLGLMLDIGKNAGCFRFGTAWHKLTILMKSSSRRHR